MTILEEVTQLITTLNSGFDDISDSGMQGKLLATVALALIKLHGEVQALNMTLQTIEREGIPNGRPISHGSNCGCSGSAG